MCKFFITFLLVLFSMPSRLLAQDQYIVYFKDKGPEKENLLQNPQLLLSQKAIDRRNKMRIAVNESDLPVSKTYLKLLATGQCTVLETSKWLNAAIIKTGIPADKLQKLLPSILEIKAWKAADAGINFSAKHQSGEPGELISSSGLHKTSTDYGAADTQNLLLGIDYLHNKGYHGDSITIAVLDVGFQKVNTLQYFDSLRNENRIKATFDFWAKREQVYYKSDHGTLVLSLMAANKPGHFVGTAPKSSYLLAITDDLFTETHNDELNWIKAVEWADSAGADIINSSLSYSIFDPGQGNYNYADMDGKTSIIAKGAAAAAAKGLLVVNSAGNGGRLCTPCDVEKILCVGGAFNTKAYDEMSSFGPTYDKRIKPDVAALTRDVFFIKSDGNIWGNWYGGTSSAAPQISGLAACLLQAHPKRTNLDIINSIIQSAHNYNTPDTLTGYGIPDAKRADSLLTILDNNSEIKDDISESSGTFSLFPNPAKEQVTIQSAEETGLITEIKIFSSLGQTLYHKTNAALQTETIDLKNFPKGIYILQLTDHQRNVTTLKLVKE